RDRRVTQNSSQYGALPSLSSARGTQSVVGTANRKRGITMSRLEHPLSQEELMAYVDGQLQGSEASKVAEHLHGCSDCAAAVADVRQLSQQMSAWEVEESPSRIAENVLAELNERAS